MIECPNCSSIYDNKHAVEKTLGTPYGVTGSCYLCPVCKAPLPRSALSKVTGGPNLLPDGSNYDKHAYKRPLSTVDVAVVRYNYTADQLEILLIKRKDEPSKGMWALSGGYINISEKEDIQAAALRELQEETNIAGIQVDQLGAVTVNDPRDYTVTVAHYALLGPEQMGRLNIVASDDAGDYKWEPLVDIAGQKLAFYPSHNTIVDMLIRKMTADIPGSLSRLLSVDGATAKTVTKVLNALLGLCGKPSLGVGNHTRAYLESRGYAYTGSGDVVKSDVPGRPANLFKVFKVRSN